MNEDQKRKFLLERESLRSTLMEVYLHFHCGDETYSDNEVTTMVHNVLCNSYGDRLVQEIVDSRIPKETPRQQPLYDDSYAERLRKKFAKK